jgi:hypothetical protein
VRDNENGVSMVVAHCIGSHAEAQAFAREAGEVEQTD